MNASPRSSQALAAERGHPEERDVAVERDRQRERARAGRVDVRELERREAEEQARGRPAAHSLGSSPSGARRLRPDAFEHPHERVGDRPPRVQDAPDVRRTGPAPARARSRRRRRRTSASRFSFGFVSPSRRGQEDEHEERGRHRAEQHAQRTRAEHPLQPAGQRTAGRVPVEERLAPQRPQRDERGDEHDRRAPEEQPRGNREIADRPDPVRDDHGLTVSSPIWMPRSSSSISKRPGTSAVKAMRAVFPGPASGRQVVAVQVDLVGDVRAHDQRHAVALLDLRPLDAALRAAADDRDA